MAPQESSQVPQQNQQLVPPSPWAYPGTPLTQPAVLGLDGELKPAAHQRLGEAKLDGRNLDEALRRAGAAPMDERYPVAAFGSNTDPQVLRRKFAAGGVALPTPMVPGTLRGATLAASAHVSRSGYIPAAAQAVPGRQLDIVVAWLDAEQLRCLTATEPNYRTAVVAGAAELMHGEHLDQVAIYNTRRGVIPLEPTARTQEDVWRHVLALAPALGALLQLGPHSQSAELCKAMLRLAEDAELRLAATQILAGQGSDPGFAEVPGLLLPKYGRSVAGGAIRRGTGPKRAVSRSGGGPARAKTTVGQGRRTGQWRRRVPRCRRRGRCRPRRPAHTR